MSEWISVRDEMPQPFVRVLVSLARAKSKRREAIGYWATERSSKSGEHHWPAEWMPIDARSGTVTHWMPLPQPPKEPS